MYVFPPREEVEEEGEMKKRCLIMHLFCTFTTWQNFKAASTSGFKLFLKSLFAFHNFDSLYKFQTDVFNFAKKIVKQKIS